MHGNRYLVSPILNSIFCRSKFLGFLPAFRCNYSQKTSCKVPQLTKKDPKPARGSVGCRELKNPGDIWKENAWYLGIQNQRILLKCYFYFILSGIMYNGVRNR